MQARQWVPSLQPATLSHPPGLRPSAAPHGGRLTSDPELAKASSFLSPLGVSASLSLADFYRVRHQGCSGLISNSAWAPVCGQCLYMWIANLSAKVIMSYCFFFSLSSHLCFTSLPQTFSECLVFVTWHENIATNRNIDNYKCL